jgi:hypothetical protein
LSAKQIAPQQNSTTRMTAANQYDYHGNGSPKNCKWEIGCIQVAGLVKGAKDNRWSRKKYHEVED